MSLLRRMPRGLYSTYVVNGIYGTAPGLAPCNGVTGSGYRTATGGTTISKSTFKGFTITQLSIETDYIDDGAGFCLPNTSTLFFSMSGAPGDVKLKKIVDVSNGYEYIYPGTGAFQFAALTETLGPNVIIYY